MKKTVILDNNFDFESSVDSLIKTLQSIKTLYPEYDNLRFGIDYNIDNNRCYLLEGDREETDFEKKARLKLKNSRSEKQRERDLKILKELKQKYENN
jgi:hypothetical protein